MAVAADIRDYVPHTCRGVEYVTREEKQVKGTG